MQQANRFPFMLTYDFTAAEKSEPKLHLFLYQLFFENCSYVTYSDESKSHGFKL